MAWVIVIVLVVAAAFTAIARAFDPGGAVRTWAIPAILAVVAAAVWWVGVYDTAEGRCDRGDFGACVVLEAQRATR